MSDVPITISLDVMTTNLQAFDQVRGQMQATFQALTEGVRQFQELASAGDRFSDVMSALKTDISEAREALNGQVDSMTLAIQANRAAQSGLNLTAEQFRAVAVRAKEFADANGMEFEPAMERLTSVLIRGTDKFHQFGIEGENQAQMIADLTRKYGHATSEIGGVTDATDKLGAAWTDLMGQVGAAMDSNGPLTRMVSAFADAVFWTNQHAGAVAGLGSVLTTLTLGPLAELVAKLHELPDWFFTSGPVSLAPGDTSINGRVPGEDVGGAAMGPSISSAPNERPSARPARRRGGVGGGGGRGALGPDTSMEAGTFLFGPGDASFVESEADAPARRRADTWREAVEAVRPAMKQYTTELDVASRKDSWFTERAERNAQARARARDQELSMAASWAGSLGQTFEQVGSALGISESAQNLIRGTTETVLAAIAWAKAVAPGGQAFIPEAVAHTAAAAMAFAAAANPSGGSTGSAGGGGVPSGAGPSFVGGGGGASGGGRTTNITINMGPGVSSARDVRREIQRALIMEADNGNPMPYRVVSSRR